MQNRAPSCKLQGSITSFFREFSPQMGDHLVPLHGVVCLSVRACVEPGPFPKIRARALKKWPGPDRSRAGPRLGPITIVKASQGDDS